MHILEEWRFRDVEQKADRAVSRLYELDSIRSDVGSMEHSMRQISSEIAEIRDELHACRSENEELKRMILEMKES